MTNRIFKSGVSRDQLSLLPARVDDYVGRDNPVRAIEAYVDGLDLPVLGFRHAKGSLGAGQPAYDPGDLLKLYLYGYLNRVRSSRCLERECVRNVELIWLLRGLKPGYRTIADFRRANWSALKATNREFVLLLRSLSLLGGETVAIDGAFFHGDASKGSIVTRKRLAARLTALDREIEDYRASLEKGDAEDASAAKALPDGPSGSGGTQDIGVQLASLMEKRAKAQADLTKLEASGETQLSQTDADARLLSKSGQVVAGYNVQIGVDDLHKLIVASEVVNDGNDTGQLHALASLAKGALGAETLTVLADAGYYNGETLKACETDGIRVYVPEPDCGQRLENQGRFPLSAFVYDAQADLYRCPAGAELKPVKSRKTKATGKSYIRYISARSVCAVCPLRKKCLSAKGKRREIERWMHEDVLTRHRARMAGPEAGAMMRRRSGLAEHPFGTLKCRAGYRHFLVRGFDKVRGEWSLMALCYNLTRVLGIIGIDRFIASMAKSLTSAAIILAVLAQIAADRLKNLTVALGVKSRRSNVQIRTALC